MSSVRKQSSAGTAIRSDSGLRALWILPVFGKGLLSLSSGYGGGGSGWGVGSLSGPRSPTAEKGVGRAVRRGPGP